jgi:ferredoxin
MPRRVEVDPELCCSSGQCVLEAPDVFEMGDDGFAQVLPASRERTDSQEVRNAVELCPAGAIRFVDGVPNETQDGKSDG